MCSLLVSFKHSANTEISTLSLHDALPISDAPEHLRLRRAEASGAKTSLGGGGRGFVIAPDASARSEEHTSELQSRQYLVCRLLLEKKKTVQTIDSLQL